MRTAYLDAFAGLSGDMILGALLDAGLEFDALERALSLLGIGGYRLRMRRKVLSGISAVKFDVEVTEPQPERRLSEIRAIIDGSGMPEAARKNAVAVFDSLAKAEAKIHHTTPEEVHFHEVGAVDSIIDVAGIAWGLDRLGVGRILVSPLPMGAGLARSRHGVIPVPPPATAELLAGFPVRLGDGESEMVTPTGAAVLSALARPAPVPLNFAIERVGYGAGTKTFADRPNVLRLMLGSETPVLESDELIELQTNIDDLNPQIYDHVIERLFSAGARDVTLTPTIMKKGRPGITLSVLAEPGHRDALAAVLFAETSTIGLRYHPVARLKLKRDIASVETRFGTIRVKVSRRGGDEAALNLSPEYDDCRRAALAHGVALRLVMQEAQEAARRKLSSV